MIEVEFKVYPDGEVHTTVIPNINIVMNGFWVDKNCQYNNPIHKQKWFILPHMIQMVINKEEPV